MRYALYVFYVVGFLLAALGVRFFLLVSEVDGMSSYLTRYAIGLWIASGLFCIAGAILSAARSCKS